MRRALFLWLLIVLISGGVFFIHSQQTAALQAGSCIDIPANPDYLVTENEQDAIAAINYAHALEHLPPLRLPANYYQLDPAHKQFVLLNLERTARGLKPLQWDANLAQMAAGYSRQLRDLEFFSHTSLISGTFSQRIDGNPVLANHYRLAAENLAGNPVPGAGAIYEYMYDDSIENWATATTSSIRSLPLSALAGCREVPTAPSLRRNLLLLHPGILIQGCSL